MKHLRGRVRRANRCVAAALVAAISKLLFGDIVVAQSRWTERRIQRRAEARVCGRPDSKSFPTGAEIARRSAGVGARAAARLRVPETAPLLVYPGDLQTSSGASVTASICEELARVLPTAVVVFAYREKTPRAREVARLEQRLAGTNVRLVSELPDVLGLVQAATALLFPVDDLGERSTSPIVLLEALSLGVPGARARSGAARGPRGGHQARFARRRGLGRATCSSSRRTTTPGEPRPTAAERRSRSSTRRGESPRPTRSSTSR